MFKTSLVILCKVTRARYQNTRVTPMVDNRILPEHLTTIFKSFRKLENLQYCNKNPRFSIKKKL